MMGKFHRIYEPLPGTQFEQAIRETSLWRANYMLFNGSVYIVETQPPWVIKAIRLIYPVSDNMTVVKR